jgi:hypothetical protein
MALGKPSSFGCPAVLSRFRALIVVVLTAWLNTRAVLGQVEASLRLPRFTWPFSISDATNPPYNVPKRGDRSN